MLISKVPDNEEGKGEGVAVQTAATDSHHDYQTANELFEFMAKNQNFNTGGEYSVFGIKYYVTTYKQVLGVPTIISES